MLNNIDHECTFSHSFACSTSYTYSYCRIYAAVLSVGMIIITRRRSATVYIKTMIHYTTLLAATMLHATVLPGTAFYSRNNVMRVIRMLDAGWSVCLFSPRWSLRLLYTAAACISTLWFSAVVRSKQTESCLWFDTVYTMHHKQAVFYSTKSK